MQKEVYREPNRAEQQLSVQVLAISPAVFNAGIRELLRGRENSTRRDFMRNTGINLDIAKGALTPEAQQKVTEMLIELELAGQDLPAAVRTMIDLNATDAVAQELKAPGTGKEFLFGIAQQVAEAAPKKSIGPEFFQRYARVVLAVLLAFSGFFILPDASKGATEIKPISAAATDDTEQTLSTTKTPAPTATPRPRTTPVATKTSEPAVTKLAVAQTQAEKTATPTLAPTAEAVEPTATPIPDFEVSQIDHEVTVAVIPAGINVRTEPFLDPEGASTSNIAFNTKDEIRLESTSKVLTTVSKDKNNSELSWYEVIGEVDGQKQTLYVAQISNVRLETEIRTDISVGGMISNEELTKQAQAAFPDLEIVAVGIYGEVLPVAIDMEGHPLAVRLITTGEWVRNSAAIPEGQEGTIQEGVDALSQPREMSPAEVRLYNLVPFNLKEEVAYWEFDATNDWYTLPEGRVPGKTAWLPIQTAGVATIEQGAFNPEDGFVLKDEESGMEISYQIAGENPLIKSMKFLGSEEMIKELLTSIKKLVELPDGVKIDIVTVDDVTGLNPPHLNGKNMSFDSAFSQVDQRLLQDGDTSNGQVIVTKDANDVISNITVYVSVDNESYKDKDPRILGDIYAYEVLSQAIIFMDMVINQRGTQESYMLNWSKKVGELMNSVLYKNSSSAEMLYQYELK